MIPTLEFKERKTALGIQLTGTVTLGMAVTISQYHGGSVDVRKQSEQYIISETNSNWITLRGRHKIIDAINKLNALPDSPHKEVCKETLKMLFEELNEPQFNIIGAKP